MPNITPAEWRWFESIYGPAATRIMRRQHARDQKRAAARMRTRVTLTALALVVSAYLVVGAAYGGLLFVVAVFDYVTR